MKNINQAVCESRDSEKVIKFLSEKNLSEETVNAINEGQIYGVYYNEKGEIVAEDIWGDIHENIEK